MKLLYDSFGPTGGFSQGPPENVVEYASYSHSCEGDLVCKVTHANPPQFNAPVFYENKTQVILYE